MIYTRSYLKSRINAGIKGKSGMLVSIDDIVDQAVRFVCSDIDLVSNRRMTQLSPALFSDVFEYACPSDMNGYKIISINPQTDELSSEYNLVPFTEFSRTREMRTVSVKDNDGLRKILIAAQIDDNTLTISTLDSLISGGGTWVAVGDAINLVADSDDYIKGSASIRFDIGSGGLTTAGMENIGLNSFDLNTIYLNGNGSIFHWVKITDTTNITNYILKIGSSSSAYITKTVTSQADGTAFKNGWNLLRFSLSGYTTVGSPDLTLCSYVSIYMTKDITKINEIGYRADHIMAKRGKIHELFYYSQYGWQSSAGVWKENSTDDTDYINAGPEEINLFISKGVELAADEVDEETTSAKTERKYKSMKDKYENDNPSESMIMISTYKHFEQDGYSDQFNSRNL